MQENISKNLDRCDIRFIDRSALAQLENREDVKRKLEPPHALFLALSFSH